jgi:serum/glucocorticoid-regulated kinase 2
MWVPITSEKEVTDFGVPQLHVGVRFEEKTSVSIDDFELLKLLGRGKFGKVFMCSQKATGKVYAVKMIRKQDLNSNAVDIHHTLVERLILSSVEHPFICNLKFAFQDSEKVYFVLQYIEGGELMYHVHANGRPLDHPRVVFYAAELVLALEYLHSRNVIYRDLVSG